ncbi:MAG: 3-phosphoshikimate 1-carboxyvinyltransferase [Sediminibacterium sp.]|nr:3-phosphoshikimate 1-carboxyvinyltransferase [Sediminibacterium sp.]
MKKIIYPSILNGSVISTTSKSAMQRACALALIKKGTTTIYNIGQSNDDLAALKIIEQLGADIRYLSDKDIVVTSNGLTNTPQNINCVESGLSMRMFTNILALINEKITITGEGSLLNRPMHFFSDILPKFGKTITTNNGYVPIEMSGTFTPTDIIIDGSLSSQYLTGLLIAFAAAQIRDKKIYVQNLQSKPYIDLTIEMLAKFGYIINHLNYTIFQFIGLNDNFYNQTTYTVEGDWSGGAFLLAAAAINNPIEIIGLNLLSAQADRKILHVLELAGVDIVSDYEKKSIIVSLKNKLKPFNFDATDCPDLFPPIAVLASFCDGVSKIKGINRLIHKESNRALTIKEEFAKLGITIYLKFKKNTMFIHGKKSINPIKNIVSSRHDHRIAMACAIVALNANKPITIENADAVNKSYPNFFNDLEKLGVKMSD